VGAAEGWLLDSNATEEAPEKRMGTRRRQQSPNYESGSDFTMEFAGFRFRFSATDFAQRVEDAAVKLCFVPRSRLRREDLQDLVALAAHGDIATQGSDLAAHVAEHREQIVGWDDDLVYWLRKLVFRGAWLDQQVKDGWLEPIFGEDGFSYRSAVNGQPVVIGLPTPSWAGVRYRPSQG
jgi:hypothetical protein